MYNIKTRFLISMFYNIDFETILNKINVKINIKYTGFMAKILRF